MQTGTHDAIFHIHGTKRERKRDSVYARTQQTPGSLTVAIPGDAHGTVLQCVVVCCSVLQCVAAFWRVCCSVLQCVAVYRRVLARVVVCCSVLQSAVMCCSVSQCVAMCCRKLQRVDACCNVLVCVAACCSKYIANSWQLPKVIR